jgi:hypothetical protein
LQYRHRDTVSQLQANEDQFARAEKMLEVFEERRRQMLVGEKNLAAIESRLAEIRQAADDLGKTVEAIASREQVVQAVKAELNEVHLISARSKADLDHLLQHRGEVEALKTRVDHLLLEVAETDERIVAIEAHRHVVDEVHDKANATVHLLDDVRINLEVVGEQKVLLDHIGKKLGHLESVLPEAQNTLRSLQQERDLALRIEHGIKRLGVKSSKPEEEKNLA